MHLIFSPDSISTHTENSKLKVLKIQKIQQWEKRELFTKRTVISLDKYATVMLQSKQKFKPSE